jgi:hypothetical protein
MKLDRSERISIIMFLLMLAVVCFAYSHGRISDHKIAYLLDPETDDFFRI